MQVESFDSLPEGSRIALEPEWSVFAGEGTVVDTQSVSGAQSLLLEPSSPVSHITRDVQTGEWSGGQVAWWDFWVLPMADDHSDPAYSIDVSGSLISMRSTQVNIRESELLSYDWQDGQNGFPTEATVSADGSSIQLQGNCWKHIPYEYTITENTVLSFEVSIANAGELIAISIDDDLTYNNAKCFQLGGSDYLGWIDDYSYTGTGFVSMSIPLGQYYTGEAHYILVLADDDTSAAADATFKNIRLHEGNLPAGEQGMLVVGNSGTNAFPLGSYFATTDRAADAWMRLTLRQDYSTGEWDLYVNGNPAPVVAGVGIEGSPTAPTAITFIGDAEGSVYVDDVQLTAMNPLFPDADNDGMSDEWELAMGLDPHDPSDRLADPDGDLCVNLIERALGTDPLIADLITSGHVYYINNATGSDTTRSGLSAIIDAPTAWDGPFSSLGKAISTAGDSDHLILYDQAISYNESILTLEGKALTLRPVGNAIIRPAP